MLFILFQLGQDHYVIEARRVVEVVPLLALKRLPQAPRGVAGIFNYRGQPVPALDLSEVTLGHPARERLSTRIIIVHCRDSGGADHLLGLIAEHATEILQRDPRDFVEPGGSRGIGPYLGPILMDEQRQVQWIHEQQLLSEPVRDLLFANLKAIET